MFKKILPILVVLIIMVTGAAGCKPSTTVTVNIPATDMMAELVRKAEQVTQAPGWLHVSASIVYDVDSENSGMLSNGTALPLEQVTDAWYHINEHGKVYQYVNTMETPAGETIQVSVFLDNVIFNLTTNLTVQMNPYSLGALDYRFSNEMQDFIDRTGKEPAAHIIEMNGRQVVSFTIEEKLDEPAATEYYLQPVHAIRSVAYYDMETGLLVRLERIRIFEAGLERTYYAAEISIEADAQPSVDILDYMAGID